MFLECDAEFSECTVHTSRLRCSVDCKGKLYRYTLVRRFPFLDLERILLVIMLNPSTAGVNATDNTIDRLMYFTPLWGFSELVVCNLFAWRSTDPKVLRTLVSPIGAHNDERIVAMAKRVSKTVVAWGNHGTLHGRDKAVLGLLKKAGVQPWCFHVTKQNQPVHPLYMPNSAHAYPVDSQDHNLLWSMVWSPRKVQLDQSRRGPRTPPYQSRPQPVAPWLHSTSSPRHS